MKRWLGLFTATLLMLLAIQAEPITMVLGYLWAFTHLAATIKYWDEDRS